MARQFNGTNQSLQSASAINLSSAGTGLLTVAFWLYWNAFANDDDLAMEFSANSNSNAGTFIVDPNSTSGEIDLMHKNGAGGGRLASFPRPSAAAWHHYMCIFSTTSAAAILAYVDGTAQSMTTIVDDAGATWGNYVLYFMSRGNASLFGAGRMAGVGIWAGALTSGNATTLASGVAPDSVGSPLFAWNLCGIASPEPAAVGGVSLTVTGATFVADPSSFVGCQAGVLAKSNVPLRQAVKRASEW